LWVFVYLPIITFGIGTLGIAVYIYFPLSFDKLRVPIEELSASRNSGSAQDSTKEHLYVLAHGLNDSPRTWSDPLAKRLELSGQGEIGTISLNWNPYSKDALRCSVDGRRIGVNIGEHLLRNENLQSLHLIGHSCGSFVVLGICEAIKEGRSGIQVQSTYLDPVSVYGGFWDYGLENFGTCADYAEVYVDVDDNVPGSNGPFPSAFTFDITGIRKNLAINVQPHIWPTIYYQLQVQKGLAPLLKSDPYIANKYPADGTISLSRFHEFSETEDL
jgi:hypothetical protein